MAGKHYIIATQRGYLVDEVTGRPHEFHSKEAAAKALAEEVKHAAQACRRSHKACSVVGSARKGSVQIRVGGRQGYNLWQRYVINERPGARKPPREVSETPVKKTPAQLDAEITEALAGGGEHGGPGGHSTIATSKISLPPGAPAAWAHRHFSKAHTPDELAEIWRVMMKPWTGMGAYYASRTGIAQSEINAVYQQHRARLGGGLAHSTIAPATRDYEYVVYPEATHRHAERSVKVPMRRVGGAVRPYDLTDAKRVAKEMGAPAGVYSVSKGRFVGYVHPSGRFVTFR